MSEYPQNPLCKAILIKDPQQSSELVKSLLSAGEDPNKPDPSFYNCRPLYLAWGEESEDGKRGLVEMLIEHGAVAHPEDKPLDDILICHAPLASTLSIFQLGHSFKEYLSGSEHEPFCNDNPLTYLLSQDRFNVIEALMPFDLMCMVNAFEISGMAPLAEMARDGELDKVQWLLDHRADVNACSKLRVGDTALDEAVDNQDLDMVRLLLDAGANPNIHTCMSFTAALRAECEFKKNKNSKSKEIARLVSQASKRFPVQTE